MDGNSVYITDIGIVFAGSVSSGKSTFVGVLTTNKLDDGNGLTRSAVLKHPHEVDNKGSSSDISSRHFVIEETNRAITLFDLCGHDKYFKSTAFGINGCFPDYAIVLIDASSGILPMTKQHFTLLLSINIPIIILVTRIDLCPKDKYDLTMKHINKYCKDIIKIPAEFINNYFNDEHLTEEWIKTKLEFFNKSLDLSQSMKQLNIPVISISNKTGYYIEFVKDIIKTLSPRNLWGLYEDNRIYNKFITNMDKKFFNSCKKSNFISAYYIDNIYTPPGIGLVVTGINRGEDLNIGDVVYIGPINKEFKEIRIRSIHNDYKQKIRCLKNHDRGTIAISGDKEFMTNKFIKRGLVIVRNKSITKTNLCFHFNAGITIFNHSTTLKNDYTPILQIGNIRQAARMLINPNINGNKDTVCCKEYAYVTFKFKYKPELIEQNQLFIFTSGNVHGVGIILDILPIIEDSDAKPDMDRIKRNKRLF